MKIKSTVSHTLLATCAALALSGCAATGDGANQAAPAQVSASAATKGTWTAIAQKDLQPLLAGNTLEEISGKWAVYYAPDGRKAVWVRSGDSRARKWFVNDTGQWCESLYRDETVRCGPQLQKNGTQVRKATQYGAVEWTGKVVNGNPRKL